MIRISSSESDWRIVCAHVYYLKQLTSDGVVILSGRNLTRIMVVFGLSFFFFQAEDGIRDLIVTGVQTCALPIYFRSVALILRETRAILQRARELIPEHRTTLEGLPGRLSQSDALSQLLQALDEAAIHPTEEELSDLFQELRPEALSTLMVWVAKLHDPYVRDLVQGSAARLAQANPAEVLKALASEDGAAQLEMVKLEIGRASCGERV